MKTILKNLCAHTCRTLAKLPGMGKLFTPPPTVMAVRLSGVIGSLGPLRQGLTLHGVEKNLEEAFSTKSAVAVALCVNSPGGAPAQAAMIAARIRQLAEKHEKPVYAFAEDVAASGGYWLLCAGDELYADASSIIGSIGVISAGFGFTGLIHAHGIERRVYTQGERKGMLDPFQPEKPEDVAHLKELQKDVHESFKAYVRGRRQGKLAADEAMLFSGAFWAGERAKILGLVDGIGTLHAVMQQKFGAEVRVKTVETGGGWLQRKLGIAHEQPGLAAEAIAAIEARAAWQAYGL